MGSSTENPYTELQQAGFWEMCVRRDLEAFLAGDWRITAGDFDADGFLGIDACGSADPLDWKPGFASLQAYREEFERQATDFSHKRFAHDPRIGMYEALTISSPEIVGDRGTIVKIFDGQLELENGEIELLAWKSIFFLKRSNGQWRFNGFVGYLPLIG